MQCPKCSFDLRGSTSDTCPECGAVLVILPRAVEVWPIRLMVSGGVMVVAYCIARSARFWSESQQFNELVNSGGRPDPAALATYTWVLMWSQYLADLCLGLGLLCITIALFRIMWRLQAPRA